jgi:hypothetical protein
MSNYFDKLRRWLAQTERYHAIYHMSCDVSFKLKAMDTDQQAIVAHMCAAAFAMGIDEGKRLDNRSQLASVRHLKQ